VESGRVRVHRVVCAIDCGMTVNPATVEAQMEGGAVLAATVIDGQRGHPVGFAVGFYRDLARLEGDSGTRAPLAAHRDELVTFRCSDRGPVRCRYAGRPGGKRVAVAGFRNAKAQGRGGFSLRLCV